MTKNSRFINNISSSESNTSIFTILNQAPIIFRNLMSQIRKHRDVHGTKSSLFTILESVFFMWEMRIDRACDNLTSNFFESFSIVWELADFSWADKSKIKRIEKKDYVFSFELIQRNFLEFSLPISLSFESWGLFTNFSDLHLFILNYFKFFS